MFFQEATPDTSGYMIAGYAVAFIVMAIYVVSMYVRARNLKQDMATLEEMDKSATPAGEESGKAGDPSSAKPVTLKPRKNY